MTYLPYLRPLPTHLPANIAEGLRWCVVSDGEQKKCSDMGSAFQSKGLRPEVKCVYGESVTDCMKKIKVIDVSYCQKDSDINILEI